MANESICYTERRRWLDAKTPVSDDPRRVPVPTRDRSTDKTTVLREAGFGRRPVRRLRPAPW